MSIETFKILSSSVINGHFIYVRETAIQKKLPEDVPTHASTFIFTELREGIPDGLWTWGDIKRYISVFNFILTERTAWEEDDGADGDVKRGLHRSRR